MLLKKIGGRNFIVNLLADYVINRLGNECSSQIVVIDVGNFFIFKGKTSSKEVLNLSEVINDFKKKYENHLGESKITNSIDLIEYDAQMKKIDTISSTLFNTENCSYHQKQIEIFKSENSTCEFNSVEKIIPEDNFVYQSEFPHGYSLDQARLLYYFLKRIFYSLPTTYPITSLTLTIKLNEKEYIQVYDNFSQSNDEVLESAILDCCELNLEKFKKEISEIKFEDELLNPLEEHEVLKKNKFGILII